MTTLTTVTQRQYSVTFNDSSTDSIQDCSFSPRWAVLALAIFMVMGAVGNALVCIAIFTERKLQNVTNYFLFSLAAVDLLVSLIVMPFSILTELHHGRWPYGFSLCVSYAYVDVFLCSASIVHMSIISIDRYLGISQPLKTRNKSKLVVLLKLIAAWVITTAISCPIIVIAIINPHDIHRDNICAIDNPYFMIYGSTLAFLIPCLVMAATYVRTTQLLRQQAITCNQADGSYRTTGGSGRSATGEGLRRTHVRHRSLMRRAQDRHRMSDVVDKSWHGTRNNPTSPTVASSQCPLSNFYNNNNGNGKNLRKQTSDTSDGITARTSIGCGRAVGDDHEICGITRRFTSQESVESSIALTPLQTRASTASTPETFRSKFKEHTINLWNKTTRRGASMTDLASEQKATRVLGLVFVCFCICWTPFFVHNFTQAFCRDQCQLPRWIATLFLWLGYISSTINPIIYTAFNERFRTAFVKIIACRCRRLPNRRDQFCRLSGGESVQTSSTAPNYAFFVASA